MTETSIIQQANAGIRKAFQRFRNDDDVLTHYRPFYNKARGGDASFISLDAFVDLCIDDIQKRFVAGTSY